jgi:phosphohistidine phosphatase SixA
LLEHVLERARKLGAEVRETAERVHQKAQEAHHLTDIARQQAERGRELSKAGRAEARTMADWLKSRWTSPVTASAAGRATTRPDAVRSAYRKKKPC